MQERTRHRHHGRARATLVSLAFAVIHGVGFASLSPTASTPALEPPVPTVTALSAVVMDASTGQVLWSKNPDVKRFPASTTKILTAILVRERTDPNEVITAPKVVEEVGGASLHLKPGEWLTSHDLLTGILARSANDACTTAAIHIAGSEAAFAEQMNVRAKELGARNSHFTNPHGLHHPRHTSTARDLAILARAAMQDPVFADLVGHRRHTINRSLNLEDTVIISKNRYLDLDKTADGIKTGYTEPAGKCYVGSATRNGYRIITVVLKSENWEADHQRMLDWAFARHELKELAPERTPMGVAPVAQGQVSEVPLGLAQPVKGAWPQGASAPEWRLRRPVSLVAPVAEGEVVSEWVAFRDGKPVLAVPAVALTAVDPRPWLSPGRQDGGWNAWLAAGILALGSSVLVRRRPRSR